MISFCVREYATLLSSSFSIAARWVAVTLDTRCNTSPAMLVNIAAFCRAYAVAPLEAYSDLAAAVSRRIRAKVRNPVCAALASAYSRLTSSLVRRKFAQALTHLTRDTETTMS